MTALAVSVVVPAHNAEQGLGRLLAALAGQTLDSKRFEVVVADDASRDGTARVAAASSARIVSLSRRAGSYAARNLGVAATSADVLAFIDSDCLPAPDWLEHGLADLDSYAADVLGGRIEPGSAATTRVTELIDLARCLDQERCVHDAGYAATANAFVRRRVFDAIGPFNQRLISGGDVEFSLRAAEAGYRLAYSPRATVVHPPRSSPWQLARKGFRTGFGSGQWEHVAAGPLRAHGAPWRSASALRPERQVLHGTRAAKSATRTRGAAVRADAAHYLLVQLPRLAGSIAATITRGRAFRS